MTSELKVDKITPASGTNTQIGEAGDTTNLSAGTVTLPTSIITGASEKTTLVDADKFLISDSAASGAFKHVTKANLGGGSNTPAFHARATSQQSASSGNYIAPIIFNQEVFDTDSAYDTSNGRFTVPSGKGGKYYVYTKMEIYNNIYDIIVRIRKNGGSDQVSQRLKRQSDSSLFATCSLYTGAILDLSAGDYLDVRVYAEASGTWYTDDSSIDQLFFGGYKIII